MAVAAATVSGLFYCSSAAVDVATDAVTASAKQTKRAGNRSFLCAIYL
jgi:hypothetical protein